MSERGYLRMIAKCDKRLFAFRKSLTDNSYNEQAKDWARNMIFRLEAIREFLFKRYELSKSASEIF
jgi:hypothetical protein